MVSKNHQSFILAISLVAMRLMLTFLAVSPMLDAFAFKCSRVADSADGPCWYCVRTSGLHHTWLGPTWYDNYEKAS